MNKGRQFLIILIIFFLMSQSICFGRNTKQVNNAPLIDELFEGFLYYADKQKKVLKAVLKKIASTQDTHELGKLIVDALFDEPPLSHLEPAWPKGTKINALFITDDGKAYVDLDVNKDKLKNMDTGSELLAVYSIVNSLSLNIPQIKMVKILIQGQDAKTLAGHIDLEYFYKANMLIVK
jgi:hypothetical protein